MKRWSWVLAVLAAVAIGGGTLLAGALGGGDEPAKVRLPSLTPEERELRELKVAASAVKLVEARREPGGWVVRVQQKTSSLSPKTLQEAAQRFFRELARTGLPVLETSFEARADSLRDVWGHRLEDVPVFRVALSGETFARINWNGFDPGNFPRVADRYFEHVLVQQAGEEEKRAGQEGSAGAAPASVTPGGGESGG